MKAVTSMDSNAANQLKMIIIADDLTGALDTCIKFSNQGIATRILTWEEECSLPAYGSVLVIDTETRHLPAEQAYGIVRTITDRAMAAGFRYIYKKTDSALRGCLGAELSAVAYATGKPVSFVPAFPKMKRTTVNGIQYIDDIPVSESAIGRDPFNPVEKSYIPDIIALQSNIPCFCSDDVIEQKEDSAIHIYNAWDDARLRQIARRLISSPDNFVFAGCAGFAECLAEMIPFVRTRTGNPKKTECFFAICGSINPVTRKQIQYARNNDVPCIQITASKLLEEDFINTELCASIVESLLNMAMEKKQLILCLSEEPVQNDDMMRSRISDCLGFFATQFLQIEKSQTMLLTGGDILMSFVRHCASPSIYPICELSNGIVCSNYVSGSKELQIISKAGGFGTETLFVDLCHWLTVEEHYERIVT